jgi:malonyl CoA-acyl carrier protein transacylase
MLSSEKRAIAIVGVGAILPDALSAPDYWNNIVNKKYSITEVPPERWSIDDFYDPDPSAPDKTYSKIGGWVRGFEFDWRRFRTPPKMAAAMDASQKWAVTIAAEALEDYGYPERPLNKENTAVILGTTNGGELHYITHERIVLPKFARELKATDGFSQLPAGTQSAILSQWQERIGEAYPTITEDSMPGELPNIVAGRIANMLNLRGPNFITDAACASSFAAINAAMELLNENQVDAVLAGGADHNMGVSPFVKFCKIGALSATGSRPFGDGADGFVMGEGSAIFLLKRLGDAERNGDKIYAVIRGVGGSSDGKGKGITAPNPIGQQLALQRAWENAGLDPATATLVEAHGTSTRVGDVVEVESLTKVFGNAPRGSIGLGSAKSNVGHLKSGAGAAGLLKATMALHHRVLPPTLNAERPNPNIDLDQTPFYLINQAQEWSNSNGTPRRCGVSAYGFGGTNFHIVLEEHIPGSLTQETGAVTVAEPQRMAATTAPAQSHMPAPVRGILALGANTPSELQDKLDKTMERIEGGWSPPRSLLPRWRDIQEQDRLIIDFGDHEQLLDRVQKARKLMGFDNPQAWKAIEAQGIFRGSGDPPGKIAFLFPGQGSQYVNMGRELAELSPVVAGVFAEADEVMTPILGQPLTDYIFVDPEDSSAINQAQFGLMQTEITQPAMLMLDTAVFKLLAEYGFKPDMVMGHSLGEYAGLIAAGIMPFADALEATAARGSEMSKVSLDDNGKMAAILAPYDVVMGTLQEVDGYVIPANINSHSQCVIGGSSKAVEEACKVFEEKGYRAILIPVSHAFHTEIVAPASGPLREVLDRLRISEPQLPLIANLTGDFYPHTPEAIKDNLQQQVASTVQWVKGLEKLYDNGVRTFVEVGPKRALRGFARDVFMDREEVLALMTLHPKTGDLQAFNQALCGLYAAGYTGQNGTITDMTAPAQPVIQSEPTPEMRQPTPPTDGNGAQPSMEALSQIVTQAVQQAMSQVPTAVAPAQTLYDRNERPLGSVVISGTGLGLPGAEKQVMDPDNALRILGGEQFIDLIPERFRKLIVDKRVTRLVKAADGSGRLVTITEPEEVVKLAGRPGAFDLTEEYGVPRKLVEALDITSQLAMAAGLDALREAGIPLVQTYKRTTTGKYLPDRWMLPQALRDETGVIFASAFPGGDRFADEFKRYYEWQTRLEKLETLEELRRFTTDDNTLNELNRRIGEIRAKLEAAPYTFDRRFLFRFLSMGHSQFAQYIGARGPNTQVNAACASTAQGIAIAEDWIRNGRCRRVIVIGGDNVTSDNLMEWVGAGFLAAGAVTTKDRVDEAALPFDRRRHGTIIGMGACALVVESEDALQERGMRGIVELLSSETSNSAFHGTRLDVNHIAQVMNNLVTAAERRFGLNRYAMAPNTVFMSHETYTPARGGSASAEVVALRETFAESANDIIIANTKGFTGHPMGVGVEDVIAVKILEHGIVPPVPNFKVVDPDLGPLNLSRGGRYPVKYAIHLAAGFGSQISLTLTRRIPGNLDRVDNKGLYDHWLADISGYSRAETEVQKRVLRVKAQGAPPNVPAASSWQHGTGPGQRTAEADGQVMHIAPARMPSDRLQPAPEPVKIKSAPAKAPPPAEVVQPKPEPAPQVTPTPVPAPDPAAEPKQEGDTVTKRIVGLVAAQTGYPEDMLDLDLDMEADLGIDTVKQAETFAAIQEEFDIPAREDLSLREYNTLEKVIAFVIEMRPDLATEITAEPAVAAPEVVVETTPVVEPTQEGDAVAGRIIALVAEQTGYPEDMLDLDLDMEADLGIDTVKQAETFAAIQEEFDIPTREDLSLREYNTLEKVIAFVIEMRPDLSVDTAPAPAPISPAPAVEREAFAETVATEDPVASTIIALVAEQTGYPEDMLDLDLDMEADLGIDTVKQAETFAAIQEEFDIPAREDLSLREYNTLEKVIAFVIEMRPDLAVDTAPTPAPAEPIQSPAVEVTAPLEADLVRDQIIALVAEQTGYPEDMLELDLDLEADLGIDTVKQAETFLAIRETFDIPQQDDLNLRDYDTLEKVIEFVYQMRPELRGASPTTLPVAAVAQEETAVTEASSKYQLQDADKMPRRVPLPSLRPPLSLCKPTGVELNEQSRVILMPDEGGVSKALLKRLQKLGATVLVLDPALSGESLTEQLATWQEEAAIQGVYWLPALDSEPPLEEMELDTWHNLLGQRVKKLFTTMRALYNVINTPGTFLVAATRLGGLHGYSLEGATAPMGGAVSGFTKAFNIEQRLRTDGQGPLVKIVDFEVSRKTAEPADHLIAETLSDPGVIEAGFYQGQRYTITLAEQPAKDGQPGIELGADTVFLVTGAAGGITSEIVSDLATASRGIFYLLDLVEAPPRGDAEINLYRSDRDALKRQFIDKARAEGKRPTPVEIEKRMMAIERSEAALRAIESVEAAGGTAIYRPVNLLDGEAIAHVIEDIGQEYGRIDVLIHAGGLLVDRTLPNKEADQFNLVFDVKADGFFNIMRAAKGLPVGATVCFSSVAGRFGNNGQTDYSAANDLLCKLSSNMRHWRPDTKAITIDWTAWDEIGMAARGSVPTVMKALGIDMLPPECGVPTVRRELVAGGFKGEVLVAGALGVMADELDETGGLDVNKANQWLKEHNNDLLMVGEIKGAKLYGGLEVETTLDPAKQPFLFDHAADEGTPWLPGVMATEALAQLATLFAPDFEVAAVKNEQMTGAFKFFHNKPRTLFLSATARPNANGDLVARTALRSVTKPAREGLPTRVQEHFAADVILTKEKPALPAIDFAPPNVKQLPSTAEQIYKLFFHGPAYQVLERVGVEGNKAIGLMALNLPPNTNPQDARSLTAPRLVELCFQTAAQWSIEAKDAMAFPLGFGQVCAYRQPEEAGEQRLYAVVETEDDGETFEAKVLDESGNVFVALACYRTVSRPGVTS